MKLKLNIFDNVFKLNVNKNCCEANDKQKILMLNLVGWVCCEICPSTIFNMSAPWWEQFGPIPKQFTN